MKTVHYFGDENLKFFARVWNEYVLLNCIKWIARDVVVVVVKIKGVLKKGRKGFASKFLPFSTIFIKITNFNQITRTFSRNHSEIDGILLHFGADDFI